MSDFRIIDDIETDNESLINKYSENGNKIMLKLVENYIRRQKYGGVSFVDYKYITGCIKISYFNIHYYDKKILLLADKHDTVNTHENKDSIISITNYFKKYLNVNTKIIDFFLETGSDIDDKKDCYSELCTFYREIYLDCFKARNCSGRFHYIDIRRNFDKYIPKEFTVYLDALNDTPREGKILVIFNWIQELYNNILYMSSQDDLSIDIYNDMKDELLRLYSYLELHLGSTSLSRRNQILSTLEDLKFAIEESDTSLENYFVYTIFEISKIKKQIENIEYPEIRELLRNKYRNLMYNFSLNYLIETQLRAINEIDSSSINVREKLIEIFNQSHSLSKPFSIINDIYTIARIFRNFKNNNNIKTAVVFAGVDHVDTMFELLSSISNNGNCEIISRSSSDLKISTDGFDIE